MRENNTTNVVVGRFQSPTLTEDQKNLLNYSLSTSSAKPTVVLGLSPLKCTAANPLDYESRKSMIEAEYPGQFNFKYIKDQNSDQQWSENFDGIVNQCIGHCSLDTTGKFDLNPNVKIIGSRDGFYDHYTGTYRDNFEEFSQTSYASTAEINKTYSKDVKNTPEWRAGVAYAVNAQYPSVYPTVDCAIFDKADFKQIYLARKKDEQLYRFVGGFTDPTDNSFEDAALREAKEETGLDCHSINYVCSTKIQDWRYANETSKIITHLYTMVKASGRAKANDDICELKLFNFKDVSEDMIQPEHRILLKKLREKLHEVLNDIPAVTAYNGLNDETHYDGFDINTKECFKHCEEQHGFDFCDKCQKCDPNLQAMWNSLKDRDEINDMIKRVHWSKGNLS